MDNGADRLEFDRWVDGWMRAHVAIFRPTDFAYDAWKEGKERANDHRADIAILFAGKPEGWKFTTTWRNEVERYRYAGSFEKGIVCAVPFGCRNPRWFYIGNRTGKEGW